MAQDRATFEAYFNNSSTGLFKDNTTQARVPSQDRDLVTKVSENFLSLLDDVYKTYLVTASGTNTYAATPSPAITAYTANTHFFIKFTNASTGASTLNLASIGAKKLYINPTTQAGSGDIVANSIALCVYDSALDAGNGGFLIVGGIGAPADASETTKGIVELATTTEATTGTDTVRAVTPAGVKAAIDEIRNKLNIGGMGLT